MLNLFSDDVRRDPYPAYDQLRAAAPAFHEPRSGLWFVFDYDGVRRALTDHDAFGSDLAATTDRPTPDWFIFFDPPRHTKLRAIISKAFTPRVVAGLEARIRELSRDLLDRVIERGQMDLATDYATPLPMKVIAGMIGIPDEDWPRFSRWSEGILRLSYTIRGIEADPAEKAAAVAEYGAVSAEMRQYVPELIAERRARPRDDLLTRLVEAEVGGERLTEAEIMGFFQLLLVGGQETTTNLIDNAILSLLENPDQLARLRANPGLLPSAIEEALRYRSPLQIVFRGTRRDVEVHGRTIPAGKLVLVMLGSANRDPRQFPDAGRFDIGRDPNPHVAFGHGVHACLGAPLARLESRIALPDLLTRLDGLALASAEPWPPRRALHVHGPASLPVRFTPGRAVGAG